MARPAKRRASSTLHTKHRMSIAKPVYSTVEPTLEEKQLLPERFRKADEWPVTDIIAEKAGNYLVEWEPHPTTGAVWKPEWREAADVSDDLIVRWRERKRKDKAPSQTSAQSLSGSRHISETSSESSLKRRRLTRRLVRSDTPGHASAQDTTTAQDLETLVSREGRNRRVILSPPTTEIPETQQQGSHTTDWIEVNVPEANLIRGEECQTVPSSSPVLGLSNPNHPTSASSKDQEADSALGLSSPIDDRFPRSTASFVDQEDEAPTGTPGSRDTVSTGHVPASIYSDESHSSTQYPRAAGGKSTSAFIQPSDLIESTSHCTGRDEGDGFVDNGTQIASSSPLFHRDAQGKLRESNIDAVRSLTPNTEPEHSQLVDRGAQRSGLHEPTVFLRQPLATRQLPRAKLLEDLNLSSGPQQRPGSFPEMSARSRESSPRVRRSAPPVDRGPSSTSLRDMLIKQTAPARALQQARHERTANRPTSRATSTATDSTRNSIPASTADASPVRPGTDMGSSLPTDHALSSNGAFSGSMQVDEPEPALVSSIAPAASVYNAALGSSALPLHPSIEDEQSLPHVTKPSLPSSPILGHGEYLVPLPAEGKIKDHYLECIRGKQRSLMKFMRNPKSTGRANMSRSTAEEAEQMRQLINRLNDTTTHLDLGLDGPAMPHTDNSINEATWTYYASSKFAFLYHLIELLRYRDCCIAVVAKEGLTLDLLEQYMKANHVNYRRPPNFAAAPTYRVEGCTGQILVNLIASGSDVERSMSRRPALIMAFDNSFDAQDAHVRRMRDQLDTDGSLIPIIYPVIINSAEHVDICIPKSMPSPQRFQMVVQATFRAREKLGGDSVIITSPPASDSPSSLMNAFVALKKSLGKRFNLMAEAVAHAALSDNFDSNWAIPPAALKFEPLSDPSSELNTARSMSPSSRAGTPSVQKRLLERDSASSISSKRQRRTPAPDVSHTSESVKDSHSQIEDLRAALRMAEEKVAEEVKGRIAAEERTAYRAKQLEEIRLSLGDLQTRYETRMTTSHQLRRENQKLQAEKESMEKRYEKLSADHRVLKEQYADFRAEVQDVRDALKADDGPSAAMEMAKEEGRKLSEKNVVLEKSYANVRKDFEFTRSQYQEASTAAAESANHVKELEAQIADLRREASDEKRRLKELNYKTDLEQHLARVLELELVLKNRDTILQRKEEELKALKKARGVTTRGSSVQPGSPRPAGSRGGSPAPGLLAPSIHAVNRASALRNER